MLLLLFCGSVCVCGRDCAHVCGVYVFACRTRASREARFYLHPHPHARTHTHTSNFQRSRTPPAQQSRVQQFHCHYSARTHTTHRFSHPRTAHKLQTFRCATYGRHTHALHTRTKRRLSITHWGGHTLNAKNDSENGSRCCGWLGLRSGRCFHRRTNATTTTTTRMGGHEHIECECVCMCVCMCMRTRSGRGLVVGVALLSADFS